MKKLALALALVAPMLFAACSKDEEKNEVSFYAPVTAWGDTQDEVKLAVPTDKQLILDTDNSDADVLAYVTGVVTEENPLQLPWYQYVFVNNKLDEVTVYVDTQYTTEYTNWLDEKYHRYEANPGDDFITYGDNKKEEKATMLIFYDTFTKAGYTFLRTEWVENVIPEAERATRAGMTDRQILREKANAAAEANFNF